MGIDIYAQWSGMTEAEQAAQITGMSVVHGHVGYLREAYHGEPYATRVLVPEAFDGHGKPVAIPAALLRKRLPATLAAADMRERTIYRETDADNIGGVFRNAAAFGAGGVLLSPTCCDPLYRKAIRTSMGATLGVPFVLLIATMVAGSVAIT